MENIRNFSIIAHIDHGKSTLADRMLEITGAISERDMKDQVLDSMDLERERGITIKMQPARMNYSYKGKDYILNLIDTPGHIDFRYEVSRSLSAVEGVILLVDATQGVQAQTLTTLEMAKDAGLVILPVVTKIDSPLARPDDIAFEFMEILETSPEEINYVSGKTGEGVRELLGKIIEEIPAPTKSSITDEFRAIIFDYSFTSHTGITIYARITEGKIKKGDKIKMIAGQKEFTVIDLGILSPKKVSKEFLEEGEIGYIITGIKEAGATFVGDTIVQKYSALPAIPGYSEPAPVVFASLYPEYQEDFDNLKTALLQLKLEDAAITFEEEVTGTLGRGFRCGFLGMLHLEIITERLRREFDIELVITSPSVTYHVTKKNGEELVVYNPMQFPSYGDIQKVEEPWVACTVISPNTYLSGLVQIFQEHEAITQETTNFGDTRISLLIYMPLRELMRNFFDEMKSASSGYASISYEPIGYRDADVVRLDILVAGEVVDAFSKVVSRQKVEREGDLAVEKLAKILPQQLFEFKIQAVQQGKIFASKTSKALRKDVTGYLYGGDITRKMKLREKQKKGKKRMARSGKVPMPQDIFVKMMKT